MRRRLTILTGLALACAVAAPTEASWIFRPSHFSHDPNSGQRVAQYAEKERAYAPHDPTYVKSGFRHRRITTRSLDGSVDRLHLVETWGQGERIRPYGEWQRPFRAGATPYGPWGNPGGPWTMPFDSWQNPYGLGQLPYGYPYPGPWYPNAEAYPRLAPSAAPYSRVYSDGPQAYRGGAAPVNGGGYGPHDGHGGRQAPPPDGHPGDGDPGHSGGMPVGAPPY